MPEAVPRSPADTKSTCSSREVQRLSFYASTPPTTSPPTFIRHSTRRERRTKQQDSTVDPHEEMQHAPMSHVGWSIQVGEREERMGTRQWWPQRSLTAACPHRIRKLSEDEAVRGSSGNVAEPSSEPRDREVVERRKKRTKREDAALHNLASRPPALRICRAVSLSGPAAAGARRGS